MAGFDELGSASFRHNMGPATSSEVAMPPPPPPQSSSSSMKTTQDHHYNTMLGLASLATWRKNDDFTRDFLGLTAGVHYGNGPHGTSTAAAGGTFVDGDHHHDDHDEVGDHMLKFTGGLQYGVTAAYDRDNSSLLFKPQPLVHHHHHHQVDGFGFVAAEPPASQTRWG